MDQANPHPIDILAEDGSFRVERCPCGTVRVTLGALTLRLSQEHSERFATVMARAMMKLSDCAASATGPVRTMRATPLH